MDITEIRVKLIENKDDRLKAFCSMTLENDFVIRDIKIIEGSNGLFVAMPSRKMSDHCEKCGGKNHLRARFCNNCGAKLKEDRVRGDSRGRIKLHADIAHPINANCRQQIQDKVVIAYNEEFERSSLPDYQPIDLDTPYEDDDIPEIV